MTAFLPRRFIRRRKYVCNECTALYICELDYSTHQFHIPRLNSSLQQAHTPHYSLHHDARLYLMHISLLWRFKIVSLSLLFASSLYNSDRYECAVCRTHGGAETMHV